MNKKIIIPPTNEKAITFFHELARRKAEIQAMLEKKFSFKNSHPQPKGKLSNS